MPDQTLDQLAEETVPQDADLFYIVRSGLDRRIKRSALLQDMVAATRTVSTASGSGLTGGGALSADRALSVDIPGLLEDTTPDPAVDFVMTHDGSAGALRKVLLSRITGTSSPNSFTSVSIAGQSSVVADGPTDTLNLAQGSGIQLTTDAATDTITIATTGLVPTSRSVSAGSGLTGGGTLTADRSLALNIAGQSEDTTPDLNADYAIIHKGANGTLRKIKLSLLGGSSYSLPIASPTILGGIRIGNGLTIDLNGVVSSVSTYTPTLATALAAGIVRPGNGLSVDINGVLTNANPTPYVLPPASVNQIGGIKPGQGVTVSSDGTLDFIGGGGGVSDGAYRPESYGAIRGSGLTLAQRQTNTTAINACWAAAGDAGSRVDQGGGTFEVSGALNITASGTTIVGDRCTIVQFLTGASVVAATSVARITLKGLNLTYGANQATGDDPTVTETYPAALRLSGVTGSYFENIATSNAWVGIGVSGSTGSFDNTFINCRAAMLSNNAYGIVHKTGSGSAFIGCGVSGGGASRTVQGGLYLAGLSQAHFTQLRVDHLTCRRPIQVTACPSVTFSGTVLENLTLVPVSGFGGVVFGSNDSGLQFSGTTVSGTVLSNTAQGVTDASVFTGELGANFLATNLFVSNTTKAGTVRFALLGHVNANPARNVTGAFTQVRLDTRADNPHRLDDLCYAAMDPASTSLDGPLLIYNNVFGAATGGFHALSDASVTAYASVHGRNLRLDTPLTANRTVTLSQYIDAVYANGAITAPRITRGAVVRVVRTTAATGSFPLTVANHNGSTLTTLLLNAAADFAFDGANWTLVPGSATTGGGGGTFATQAEAEAGVSATTYMSPVRTKDAIGAYAGANEIGGSEGQVVGFNASGLATAVKNTRIILLTAVAEGVALTAGADVRRFLMPMGLKALTVQVYTPVAGTTATTVDVNIDGVSMLSAPITVAANTHSTTVTAFATQTMTFNTVISIDLDTAGTGAKGLQVRITGVEV